MPSTKSQPVTVRIPREVLDALDAEAEQLELSRSEVVTRRLRKSLRAVPELSKTEKIASDPRTDALPELEGD